LAEISRALNGGLYPIDSSELMHPVRHTPAMEKASTEELMIVSKQEALAYHAGSPPGRLGSLPPSPALLNAI